jgi:hypothetical protein
MAYAQKNKPLKEKKIFEVSYMDKRQPALFRQSNAPKEYNGWTNYTTWSVALNIDNDQYMQEETLRVIKEGEVTNGYELKDWFKQTLEDSDNYNEDYHSFKISDAWSERELDDDVNWTELYNSYAKQVKENEEYETEKVKLTRPEIASEMRTFIKKSTTKDNKDKTLQKNEIFKQIKGDEEDKEAILKKLEEDGEIFQRKKGEYQWIE